MDLQFLLEIVVYGCPLLPKHNNDKKSKKGCLQIHETQKKDYSWSTVDFCSIGSILVGLLD